MIDIIGGSGFIGTRFAARLEQAGTAFRLLDKVVSARFPEHHRQIDVRDIASLRRHVSGAYIVNLAAEHRDDVRPVSLYHDVNVQGARNVCAVAAEKGIERIIFTSTVAVYGFAPPGTDEQGAINPFNEYGRTKYEAECVYRDWQAQDPKNRVLVIIRPTVVFGEQNRGNVYNLLRHVADGRFVMVGSGRNVKSMAYVENIAAFLKHALSVGHGVHLYNYVDKPDFDMNTLVATVRDALDLGKGAGLRLPYGIGIGMGYACDFISWVRQKPLGISSIRVRKFCSTTQFGTAVDRTGFTPPVSLPAGLLRTIRYEFLEDHAAEKVFFTE